ncbi:hypothetical protein PsYK624_090160 [Phanerochaete sordida]|uniref:Pentacotripeptide-repeat region of PRORP domain-containing protein n=1 Tax=Phanerochaete sordida TaxID=48140 RepID=A0A9P3GDF1_9APHY|nr:hypothetical protein PsYK624_090160 [Phanerochaete sordida]
MLKPRISPQEYEKDSHSLYSMRKSNAKAKGKAAVPFGDPQPRVVSTLEDRVNALKHTVISGDALKTHEFYDESHLLALYEDLLALPQEETQEPAVKKPEEDPLPIVQKIAERLLPDISEPSTSAIAAQPMRYAILQQLDQVIADLETAEAYTTKAESEDAADAVLDVPVMLVSQKEWMALIYHCIRERDTDAAERALSLMIRAKCDIPEETFNAVLVVYARTGNVAKANDFVSKFLIASPTETQRDLHIRTYLEAISDTAFPTDALHILHDYETRGLAPPQKAYSRVITHLLSARSAVAHAHAWDLFAHMRYVAHPKPDAFMYATMIRACASSAISNHGEPERALDLFTEMTVDNGIAPTAAAYIATILACARSGRAKYVHEGFRLAKQMMDAHRDAYGHSQFMPDRRFFCALLEGAKRIGDLGRVRWILAEMARESMQRGADGQEQIDPRRSVHEEIMLHVFHAYAAYRVPFHRSLAPKAPQDKPQDATTQQEEPEALTAAQAEEAARDLVAEPDHAFTRLPPQSHPEVLYEAQALFARLRADRARGSGVFAHVEPTPRLLNAYLSVHYAHAPLERWRALWSTLHADAGVPRNAHTYVEVLERCANAKKPERPAALQVAEEAFAQWRSLEDAWRATGPQEVAAHARLIERAHAAMIRLYALTNDLDRAVELTKAFAAAYPPSTLRDPPARAPFRSTRTNLLGARPLVRVFNAAEIPDDAVPPLLAFGELEALHHRLAAAGRTADVRYVTWLCKAYEGALRARRERALEATMHPVYRAEPAV